MCDMVKSSPGQDDWRAESDYRSLQNAAEVMADQIRMRGVLRHQTKVKKTQVKMTSMLTGFKRKGALGG